MMQHLISMDIRLSKIKVELPNGRKLFEIRDAHFPSGSHTLVTGASGLGKSTLLHLISGLFVPHEGHVTVGEHDITKLSDQARSHLRKRSFGIVFQKLNLIDHMTVAENVLIGRPQAISQKEYAPHIERALKSLGINLLSDALSGKLSLGEQQRVAVARVLASMPDVLLADEPTSSLDDENADLVIKTLKLAAEGRTLIIVSHDHRIRKAFSNHVEFSKNFSFTPEKQA